MPTLSNHNASPSVSVVIPALNEAKNLPFVLRRIPWWVNEVVLVDGHSTDNTIEVAKRLLPSIRVVHQKGCCKGAALRQGFAASRGDIIVMLDADGSTDPAEMGMFVRLLRNGADLVKGSRFMQGSGTADISRLRSLGNKALTVLTRLLYGCSFSDLCYGYIAFWRYTLPILDLDADGFEIETLIAVRALRARLRVMETHSFEGPRLSGESHLRTWRDGFRVLTTILKERFVPSRQVPASGGLAPVELERAGRWSVKDLVAPSSIHGGAGSSDGS